MTTIIPHSELLQRAVKYISEARTDSPEKHLDALLDEASMRFNLSPLDTEALSRLFAKDPERIPEFSDSGD